MEFEKAAQILRTIRQIEKTIESQHVDRPLGHDADAIGIYRHGEEVILRSCYFRGGRLVGRGILISAILQRRTPSFSPHFFCSIMKGKWRFRPEILVPAAMGDRESVEEILSGRHKHKVSIRFAAKRRKKGILGNGAGQMRKRYSNRRKMKKP